MSFRPIRVFRCFNEFRCPCELGCYVVIIDAPIFGKSPLVDARGFCWEVTRVPYRAFSTCGGGGVQRYGTPQGEAISSTVRPVTWAMTLAVMPNDFILRASSFLASSIPSARPSSRPVPALFPVPPLRGSEEGVFTRPSRHARALYLTSLAKAAGSRRTSQNATMYITSSSIR